MVCRAASRTAPTRAREISAPVASPPAWAMRRRWWPPSRVSAMSPLSVVSKCAPVLISRMYGVGALGDQGAHGLLVAEARARDEGVVEVLLGGVALAERGGDAALGPAGRAVVEAGLGDDDGVQAGGGAAQRRGQPGDAGADDHDVRVDGPAGGGGGQPYSGHVRAPKVRGMLSMRRVSPIRAATARIASPFSRSSGISVKSAGSTRAR